MRRRASHCLACALVAVTSAACVASPSNEPALPPNVILISVDTLRPDHLGCYGYSKPVSPAIDTLRNDAVLFTEAIAHAPSTLPSHASIFTSQLPQHHLAWHTAGFRLPEGAVTLTERLREAGYTTLAVTGGGQLAPEFGLDQGFISYSPRRSRNPPGAKVALSTRNESRDAFWNQTTKALRLLRDFEDRPFFLFLHTYEIHHPYTPSADDLGALGAAYAGDLGHEISVELLVEINEGRRILSAADLAHVVDTYDAEIRSMDRALGVFLSALKKEGLYRDSLIVFTSDHGEEFGEHGRVGWHSHTLFDELLRIPLLLKLPGNLHAGMEVSGQVRAIDIAPTILDLLGLEAPEAFAGTTLVPALLASPPVATVPPAGLWRETAPHESEPTVDGVRVSGWKMAEGFVYDLTKDPTEQYDVSVSQPSMRERLQLELESLLTERQPETPELAQPGSTTLDQLRELGYVVGPSGSATQTDAP